jgi:hypothetical protein
MIPPLPETDESRHDRFKRFATAILAVPKSEIMPREALSQLEEKKRKIESKIVAVQRQLAKRKATIQKQDSS